MVPKVSIIVAAYNVGKYIERCLNSLRNQTLKDIEVLVINDGSTDNTKNICHSFEEIDQRFKVFSQENGGLSEARNKGIKIATADFIAFVDGDDYVDETMYEKLYKKITSEKADLAISGFLKIWEDQTFRTLKSKRCYFNSSLLNEDISINFLKKHDEPFVVAWNKLYKLEIIKNQKILFVNKAFFEDVGFMVRYLNFTKKICFIKETLYYYSQRDGSITKSFNPIIEESLKKTLQIAENYYNNNSKNIHIFKLRLLIYTFNYYLNNNFTNNSLKQEIIKLEYYFKYVPIKHRFALYFMKIGIYESIYKLYLKLRF